MAHTPWHKTSTTGPGARTKREREFQSRFKNRRKPPTPPRGFVDDEVIQYQDPPVMRGGGGDWEDPATKDPRTTATATATATPDPRSGARDFGIADEPGVADKIAQWWNDLDDGYIPPTSTPTPPQGQWTDEQIAFVMQEFEKDKNKGMSWDNIRSKNYGEQGPGGELVDAFLRWAGSGIAKVWNEWHSLDKPRRVGHTIVYPGGMTKEQWEDYEMGLIVEAGGQDVDQKASFDDARYRDVGADLPGEGYGDLPDEPDKYDAYDPPGRGGQGGGQGGDRLDRDEGLRRFKPDVSRDDYLEDDVRLPEDPFAGLEDYLEGLGQVEAETLDEATEGVVVPELTTPFATEQQPAGDVVVIPESSHIDNDPDNPNSEAKLAFELREIAGTMPLDELRSWFSALGLDVSILAGAEESKRLDPYGDTGGLTGEAFGTAFERYGWSDDDYTSILPDGSLGPANGVPDILDHAIHTLRQDFGYTDEGIAAQFKAGWAWYNYSLEDLQGAGSIEGPPAGGEVTAPPIANTMGSEGGHFNDGSPYDNVDSELSGRYAGFDADAEQLLYAGGAPAWWVGYIPESPNNYSVHVAVMNAILPFLSKDGQQSMGASVYANLGPNMGFDHYMALPDSPLWSEDFDMFEDPLRWTNLIDTLIQLQGVLVGKYGGMDVLPDDAQAPIAALNTLIQALWVAERYWTGPKSRRRNEDFKRDIEMYIAYTKPSGDKERPNLLEGYQGILRHLIEPMISYRTSPLQGTKPNQRYNV